MKQFVAKLIVILLIVAVLPVNFSFAQSNQVTYIRVGIAFGNEAVSSATLESEDGLMIIRAVSNGFEEIMRFPDVRQVNVSIESGVIVARDVSGEMIYDHFDNDTVIAPLTFADGGLIRYNGRAYRGGICFFPTSNDRMNVINFVDLEHYIAAVVHAEISQSSPMEALKAQAVAARSFAVTNLGRHGSAGFDLCAGTHCQVYRGYQDEFYRTIRATNETAGLVITYNGVPVQAFYFKNSGGHTQSSEDVWGGRLPHVVGVQDPFSPDFPWTYQVTFQTLSTRLQAAGHQVGSVQSVAIRERNASGAVSVVEISGTSGTVELRNERFRTMLGSTNVRSMMFSFGGSESTVGAGTTSRNILLSNGYISRQISSEDAVHIIGANGNIEQRNIGNLYVISNGASVQLGREAQGNQERLEIVTSGSLIIHGMGFGHGVGMPQDSAIAKAGLGYTFEQILKFYYTGIEIRQLSTLH